MRFLSCILLVLGLALTGRGTAGMLCLHADGLAHAVAAAATGEDGHCADHDHDAPGSPGKHGDCVDLPLGDSAERVVSSGGSRDDDLAAPAAVLAPIVLFVLEPHDATPSGSERTPKVPEPSDRIHPAIATTVLRI